MERGHRILQDPAVVNGLSGAIAGACRRSITARRRQTHHSTATEGLHERLVSHCVRLYCHNCRVCLRPTMLLAAEQ